MEETTTQSVDYLTHYISHMMLAFLGLAFSAIGVIGVVYDNLVLAVFMLAMSAYMMALASGTKHENAIRDIMRRIGAAKGPALETKEEQLGIGESWK